MANSAFVRWMGAALAAGGTLEASLNVVLTPLVVTGAPFEQTATSSAYLWRQSLSALSALLLLFGSIGLYVSQQERGRRFGVVAFVAAFVGSSLLLAWEWVDIFVLRALAFRAPGALKALEEAKGIDLYDLGAIIPISLFTLGWLTLAGWTWRVTPVLRTPAALVVLGFFAIPLLSAALGPAWGGALGNLILGGGFCLLGLAVRRAAPGAG